MSNSGIKLDSYPSLVLDFDFDRNYPITPDKVAHKSNKKIHWLGNVCKHSWEAVVASRVAGGNKCPVCANQKVLAGFNDLATKRPDLARNWDWGSNECPPSSYLPQSNKKVAWVGVGCGHRWKAIIADRYRGRGCSICASKTILAGFNDLQSKNPELISEWDHEKNFGLLPSQVSASSAKKVWWVCPTKYKHSYRATPANRIRGKGCAICGRRGSKIEEATYEELKSLVPSVEHGAHLTTQGGGSRIVDIYDPVTNVVIEYDGYFWHRDKELSDVRKTQQLLDVGHLVVRVREISQEPLFFLPDLPGLTQMSHDLKESTPQILAATIKAFLDTIDVT